MDYDSQGVTENRRKTFNSKNRFTIQHLLSKGNDSREKPMGVPLYIFIPVGVAIASIEGVGSKIFGTTMALAGYAAMYSDGLTPLRMVEGIGELAYSPIKAYKTHKKIKRAKKLSALRTSRLESELDAA